MSTKIYDAYEWDGSVSDLMLMLRKMRITYIDLVVNWLADNSRIHNLIRNGVQGTRSSDVIEQEIKKAMDEGGHDSFNFAASSVVYPYRDRVFVQFFGIPRHKDSPLYISLKKRRLTDFHFQDSADAPDELLDQYWKEREQIWDKIFAKPFYSPSEAGLVYTFLEQKDLWIVMYRMWDSIREKHPELMTANEARKENRVVCK